MAINRFDQYQESEYVPQYVPLPIEDISRAATFRQGKHEENLAKNDYLDDLLGTIPSLGQDDPEKKRIINEYRQQMQEYGQSGDYSQAGSYVRRLTQKFKNDLVTGKLGAIKGSYDNYLKDIEQINKSDIPSYEKERLKQIRLQEYQGIGEDTGEGFFNQIYRPQATAGYFDLGKTAIEVASKMSPQVIKSTTGWDRGADGVWTKGTFKTTELPADVIEKVVAPYLANDPKAQDYLYQASKVYGVDPQAFLVNEVTKAARTAGAVLKRNDKEVDQDMNIEPEWYNGMMNMYSGAAEIPVNVPATVTYDANGNKQIDMSSGWSFRSILPGVGSLGGVPALIKNKDFTPQTFKHTFTENENKILDAAYIRYNQKPETDYEKAVLYNKYLAEKADQSVNLVYNQYTANKYNPKQGLEKTNELFFPQGEGKSVGAAALTRNFKKLQGDGNNSYTGKGFIEYFQEKGLSPVLIAKGTADNPFFPASELLGLVDANGNVVEQYVMEGDKAEIGRNAMANNFYKANYSVDNTSEFELGGDKYKVRVVPVGQGGEQQAYLYINGKLEVTSTGANAITELINRLTQ